MADEEETQTVADARDTRQLVIAASLRLAGRVLDKLDGDQELSAASIDERLPAGGFEWHMHATAAKEHDFVRVAATPQVTDRIVVSQHEMARIMGNDAARFDVQVPWEWVRLAMKGAEDAAFGFSDGIDEAITRL